MSMESIVRKDLTRTHIVATSPPVGSVATLDLPHLMYGPPGHKELVFVDSLPRLHKIRKLPSWTSRTVAPTDPACEARAVPGKGIGLVASRDIRYGETIIRELPTLLLAEYIGDKLSDNDLEGLLRDAIDGLSIASKAAVEAQMNVHPDLPQLLGILITNSFGRRIGEAQSLGSARALYRDISRANHSCSPNSNYQSHFDCLEGTLHAVRPIQSGEEITISYLDLISTSTRAERRAILAPSFGFECQCECCALPPTRSRSSDDLRRKLKAFFSPGSARSTEVIDHALQWAAAERIATAEPEILLAGFLHHLEEGRLDQAKRWAKKCRAACVAVYGEVSSEKEAVLGKLA